MHRLWRAAFLRLGAWSPVECLGARGAASFGEPLLDSPRYGAASSGAEDVQDRPPGAAFSD